MTRDNPSRIRFDAFRLTVRLVLVVLVFGCGFVTGIYSDLLLKKTGLAKEAVLNAYDGAAESPPLTYAERKQRSRATLFDFVTTRSDIVMIGDSLIQRGLWSEIFPDASIANRGVPGDAASDILRRMDTILSLQPKRAFIMVGINDIARGHDVASIFSDYKKIIARLRNHGIEVIVHGTIECNREICGDKLMEVRELNRRLRTYAAGNELVFIDLNEALSSPSEGLRPEYTFDGVHVQGKAYAIWADRISGHMTF